MYVLSMGFEIRQDLRSICQLIALCKIRLASPSKLPYSIGRPGCVYMYHVLLIVGSSIIIMKSIARVTPSCVAQIDCQKGS